MWTAAFLGAPAMSVAVLAASATDNLPPWLAYLLNFGILGLLAVAVLTRRLTTTAEMRERLTDKDTYIATVLAENARVVAKLDAVEGRERAMKDKLSDDVMPVLRDAIRVLGRTA